MPTIKSGSRMAREETPGSYGGQLGNGGRSGVQTMGGAVTG